MCSWNSYLPLSHKHTEFFCIFLFSFIILPVTFIAIIYLEFTCLWCEESNFTFSIFVRVCNFIHPSPLRNVHVCLGAKSYSTLWDTMDCSPPGSSVLAILQARILEWVGISYSRASAWSRDWICDSSIFCIGRWILHHYATWEAHSVKITNKFVDSVICWFSFFSIVLKTFFNIF